MTAKQIQLLLDYLGYDPGPLDGVLGPTTVEAVRNFQHDFTGLQVDGVPGMETQKALRHAVAYGMPEKEERPTSGTPPDKQTGTFWDGIKYLTRLEFRCPCGKCGGFPVEPKEALVRFLDMLRAYFGKPLIVVPADGHSGGSGVRCAAYNATLKGSARNSTHLQGRAADFSIPGVPAAEIIRYLTKAKAEGKIAYWYQITSGAFHVNI